MAGGASGRDERRAKHCDQGPRQATPSPRVRQFWLHGDPHKQLLSKCVFEQLFHFTRRRVRARLIAVATQRTPRLGSRIIPCNAKDTVRTGTARLPAISRQTVAQLSYQESPRRPTPTHLFRLSFLVRCLQLRFQHDPGCGGQAARRPDLDSEWTSARLATAQSRRVPKTHSTSVYRRRPAIRYHRRCRIVSKTRECLIWSPAKFDASTDRG